MNGNITTLIVIFTCVTSYWAEENDSFKRKWLHNAYMVNHRREYYRWLSSGFIHSGYVHLAFNMITLYSFGQVLEMGILASRMGIQLASITFLVFYLAAIVISDLPSSFKYQNNPAYNSLGASGGVSAVIMAVILFYPALPLRLFFVPIDIPGFLFAIFYLFYSAYMAQNSQGNINHNAHLFGALFGVAFAVFIDYQVVFQFIDEIGTFFF